MILQLDASLFRSWFLSHIRQHMVARMVLWCDLACSRVTLHMRYEWKFLDCSVCCEWSAFDMFSEKLKCSTWILTSKNKAIPLNAVPCFDLLDFIWILVLRLKRFRRRLREEGTDQGEGELSSQLLWSECTLVCWSCWKFSAKRPCAFV